MNKRISESKVVYMLICKSIAATPLLLSPPLLFLPLLLFLLWVKADAVKVTVPCLLSQSPTRRTQLPPFWMLCCPAYPATSISLWGQCLAAIISSINPLTYASVGAECSIFVFQCIPIPFGKYSHSNSFVRKIERIHFHILTRSLCITITL